MKINKFVSNFWALFVLLGVLVTAFVYKILN